MVSARAALSLGAACFVGVSGYSYISGKAWFFKHVAMPLLARVDPETAHLAAVYVASKGLAPRDLSQDPPILATTVWGRRFSNPIGLAAGFDKHAEAYQGMWDMGFGFVEVGSVTPEPQEGNPWPRVFKLVQDRAIINRYGFNSHGHSVVRNRLEKWSMQRSKYPDKQLGVSLGKNKETREAEKDYVKGVRALGEFADYLVVNISSPNTPGLTSLQAKEKLTHLLDTVIAERDSLPADRRPPLLVKISPDLSPTEREDVAACVLRTHPHRNPDGLIITNTTMTRPVGLRSGYKNERGGLSGEPVREMSTEAIRDMYRLTDGRLPIIGVGGVSSGRDAYEKLRAGASLVQLYTSLALEGPSVVGQIKRELAEILRSEGHATVASAVGADHREMAMHANGHTNQNISTQVHR